MKTQNAEQKQRATVQARTVPLPGQAGAWRTVCIETLTDAIRTAAQIAAASTTMQARILTPGGRVWEYAPQQRARTNFPQACKERETSAQHSTTYARTITSVYSVS